MRKSPHEKYLDLMKVVRNRLDIIQSLANIVIDDYSKSEIAAFHGRKIIEAIAFGCLIGTKHGLDYIPKDAIGQYNAETIIKTLKRKEIDIFQNPSKIRNATEQEQKESNAKIIIEGKADRVITKEEMIKKYQRMHNWLHELNPYTKDGQETFHKNNKEQLWKDLNELELFLKSHFISLKGEGFFCTLRDKEDGLTKIISLSKRLD